MSPPSSTITAPAPGRHRSLDPPYAHRRVAVLVVAAVALVLAAGVSVAAFVIATSESGPPAGTRR